MKTIRRSSPSASGHLWRVWAVGIVVLLVLSPLPLASLVSSAPGEAAHALAAAEAAVPGVSTAQAQGGSPLASQTLGRGYWHVFIAYAVAWLLVLGWAISIARRLSKVEREIEE